MPLDQFHLIAVEQFKSIVIQHIHTIVPIICIAVKIRIQLFHILGNSKITDYCFLFSILKLYWLWQMIQKYHL